MQVIITGATGLVGTALQPVLTQAQHQVRRLTRRKREGDDIVWDPAAGTIDRACAGRRRRRRPSGWREYCRRALDPGRQGADSRQPRTGDAALERNAGRSRRPPRVLISASAIGYYGDRGNEVLDEQSPPGSGFLPEVCRAWESATTPAEEAGIRVVHLRFGVILSPSGGALKQMLFPFRMGVGGRLGSGQQFMSWVALDDVVEAIAYALQTDSLHGAVNGVAPQPVTNLEFTKTLGRVLGRPTILPTPAAAVRLLFGEMADALLLASARVVPRALERSGYGFRYPQLEHALRHLLGKTNDASPYAA